MTKTSTKTVEVQIPELPDLQLDPAVAQQLDTLCQESRRIQDQIKPLEKDKARVSGDIKLLAATLPNLPDRVLGAGWDLRKSPGRASFNLDALKIKLLHQNFVLRVECPQIEQRMDGSIEVCSRCGGTGARTLDGLAAVNALIESCTERGSESWAVYGRGGDRNDKG